MTRIPATLALSAAILLAFAGAARGQRPALRGQIEEANKQFMTVYQKADAPGVAALYTADAEALPPNGDVVRGRDAIQKMWQSVMDGGIASVTLTTRDVEGAGDMAWESGTYELFGKDGAPLDRGKYVVIWKRAQGQWRLHRDIWNSNQPAKP